jgi:hypothetical protein
MELIADLVARLPERQAVMAFGAVTGERTGVDRIGFAERAERANEGFDLAGIGTMGGAPGAHERVEQGGFVTPGRFADDEAGRIEPAAKASSASCSLASVKPRLSALSNTAMALLPTSQPMKRVAGMLVGMVRSVIAGYP